MAITAGSNLNSVPAPGKQTLSSNYIDFTATATAGWAQQYLPDLMEKELSQVFYLKLEQKRLCPQTK